MPKPHAVFAEPRTRRVHWLNIGFQAGAFVLALAITSLILLIAGAQPLEAFKQVFVGSFGSLHKFTDVLVAFVPLLLATAGVLVTFAAGLWNIGVEGQITLGAIFSTLLLRAALSTSLSPAVCLILAVGAGIVGGALWAVLAGALKTFGGVNEIFGGLGLNFVGTALTLYLIFGPWKRPGVGSMSGTEPFPAKFSLPTFSGMRLSPWALVLGAVALIVVYVLLQRTYTGLRMKAVGNNSRAAFLLGVPTWQYLLLAFAVGGGLAGLAGSLQVLAVYHRLIPSISSGYGFLGLLVAMLIKYRAVWAAPVALFFAALNIGSIQLPIVLRVDSTLAGVLQGVLVLSVIVVEGARRRFLRRAAEREQLAEDPDNASPDPKTGMNPGPNAGTNCLLPLEPGPKVEA